MIPRVMPKTTATWAGVPAEAQRAAHLDDYSSRGGAAAAAAAETAAAVVAIMDGLRYLRERLSQRNAEIARELQGYDMEACLMMGGEGATAEAAAAAAAVVNVIRPTRR